MAVSSHMGFLNTSRAVREGQKSIPSDGQSRWSGHPAPEGFSRGLSDGLATHVDASLVAINASLRDIHHTIL